nr:immunoglobulin heavy chain junction region [Mus musculus]
ISVREHRGL